MEYKDDYFPFRTVLSLEPLIDFWRELEQETTGFKSNLATQVLNEIENVSALRGEIEDISVLEEHSELLDLLMSILLPVGMSETSYSAAILPWDPKSFYTTPAFERENLMHHLMQFYAQKAEHMSKGKTVNAYLSLLAELYDQDSLAKLPMFFPVHNEENGLVRFFKIDFDARFSRVKKLGPLPELDKGDFAEIMSNVMDLDLWQKKLPPELIEFHGFGLLTAVEVTEGQIISILKNDLLQKDALSSPAKIEQIQGRIRSLMRMPDLNVGLVSIARGDFDKITSIQPLGRSILLSKGVAPSCPMWNKSLYSMVCDGRREPMVMQNLDAYENKTGFEIYLIEQGYHNILLAPLHYEDGLVGILEVASPNPNDLNGFTMNKLDEIMGLFALAIHRGMDEQEDRVQAIIKEQYTSIHPAVEWRFREAALDFIRQQGEPDVVAQADSIVFQDVYPLYGLSDIRGSSEVRNVTIQADLISQLELAHAVLIEAQKYRPLHVIDEMSYQLSVYSTEIESELRSGDEINILNFLKDEVEPLFDELIQFGASVDEAVTRYRDAIDSDLGVLYQKRKEYEQSVRMINDTIGAFIDKREVDAQKMYPHFFEMFKTDGVDYNLYVGASLVENRSYDSIYLRNLRLWQLMLMCGVQWEMDKLIPTLKVPLHVAHLILVQNMPLSIRFRVDEKKFDVDGAYNIRYEIVKKRIDKARIEGTRERLTQPGKIAIVYSQDAEVQEYQRYIKYMQASGYFTEEVEDVSLENLQGVHGLRALRVSIRPQEAKITGGPISELHAIPLGDGASNTAYTVEVDSPESLH
ncbi:MAG: GAF domain-containing protein [Rhodothermales bacterium]